MMTPGRPDIVAPDTPAARVTALVRSPALERRQRHWHIGCRRGWCEQRRPQGRDLHPQHRPLKCRLTGPGDAGQASRVLGRRAGATAIILPLVPIATFPLPPCSILPLAPGPIVFSARPEAPTTPCRAKPCLKPSRSFMTCKWSSSWRGSCASVLRACLSMNCISYIHYALLNDGYVMHNVCLAHAAGCVL